MKSTVLLLFPILMVWFGGASGEEAEFYPGLEPEEIMKVNVKAQDVTDKGMAEIITEAGGATDGDNFQMDMKMDSLQRMIYYNPKLQSAFAGAAIIGAKYRWPKKIIPYKIEKSITQTSHIYSAMKEWMEQTCIVFKPASSSVAREVGHSDAAIIFSDSGCYSPVGYQNGGFQKISLANAGCNYHSTALHELGHTIGLHHEQCRMDRDNYVKILFNKIEKNNRYNYDKQTDTDNLGVKYDYCSIMHYEGTSFAKNPGDMVMLTKDQDYQFTIGRSKFLSFTDSKIVNKMYNCNSHCGPDTRCKEPCYMNHKCHCVCPSECEKRPCDDYPPEGDPYYDTWCQTYGGYPSGDCHNPVVKKHCAKSCGVCAELKHSLG